MTRNTSPAGHGPRRDGSKDKFWRRTLRQFTAAEQSVRAFCAERGLSEPLFYAWRRTLSERGAAAAKATPPTKLAPAFVPIRLSDAAGRMELVLAGGVRIRLRPPVDRAALAEVMAALRSLA